MISKRRNNRVSFFCPGCDLIHSVTVEGLYAWTFNNDYEAPTFSPSILVTRNYGNPPKEQRCHSFVESGKIRFLNDCTHKLVGQTIALPDLPDWI